MDKDIRVQLGRAWLSAEDVACLDVGSEIELDSPCEEGVEVYAGTRRIAWGDPAVMDGAFCVRVRQVGEAAAAAPAGPGD